MKYEVALCKLNGQDWRVEASDDESEGECYVTIFTAFDTNVVLDTSCDWSNCYYAPPAPKDETARTRRREYIESFLASRHRRSMLLLTRCAEGKTRIRRERVWRPPRVL